MAGVNLSNMFYHAHEIVGTGPRKLKVILSTRVSSAVCIREHVELEGENNGRVDFSCPLVSTLLEFKPLCVARVSKRARDWGMLIAMERTLS